MKDAGKVLDTGSGFSITTTKKFPIPLIPGWNDIGNPFNFSIPITKIHFEDGTTPELRYYFDGEWNNPMADSVKQIEPFEGYTVFNDSPYDRLYIDPTCTSDSISLPKKLMSPEKSETLWSIKILAQCRKAKDVDNLAVVCPKASRGWDIMDRPEPPGVGEYVSVYFSHPEWEKITSKYCIDVRPEPLDGETWTFNVKSNINEKVKLTFEGIDLVSEQFEVWLVDEKLNIIKNLREKNTYYVTGSNANCPKRLELVVGNNNFIEETLAEVKVIPKTFELSQNFPNPFNPSTTIKYGLPKDSEVTMKIFNMLGQEVAALIDKEIMPAGYHAVVWDGRNEHGTIVANGIYLCHFHSGNIALLRKMVFMK